MTVSTFMWVLSCVRGVRRGTREMYPDMFARHGQGCISLSVNGWLIRGKSQRAENTSYKGKVHLLPYLFTVLLCAGIVRRYQMGGLFVRQVEFQLYLVRVYRPWVLFQVGAPAVMYSV